MHTKIVFVTSAQPSANPRMLKSVITLFNLGYDVTVIYARISPWANQFDEQLFEQFRKINWVGVGVRNQNSILYYLYRMRQKIWRFYETVLFNISSPSAKSFTMYSQELENKARKQKAHLFIGHNLGALKAIYTASIYNASKAIFDLEDYHRGEHKSDSFYYKVISKYEAFYLPKVNNCTTSSPMIAERYGSHFQELNLKVFLNVFSTTYAPKKVMPFSKKPLKIIWFSQHVGTERGLQLLLKVMKKFDVDELTLTIIGNINVEKRKYFLNFIESHKINKKNINLKEVISEHQLFQELHKHHVGIASEVINLENRDICLTNKLFSYLLSGLAIAASNTAAQSQFFNVNRNLGFVYQINDEESLFQGLKKYIQNPSLLEMHRTNALNLALSKYNWETQSSNWVSFIQKQINSCEIS